MTFSHSRVWRLLGVAIATSFLTGCLTEASTEDPAAPAPTTDTNGPPAISGTPAATATIGSEYSFAPTATDSDGDSLTFSIQQQPSWTEFDPATGTLSATPASGDAGTYAGIIITVSDGAASASLPAFTIVVEAADGGDGGADGDDGEDDEPPPVADAAYVGFGSATKGAMSCPTGMVTYEVTSLSAGSGSGTLRDAVSEDCRHIVFEVGGNIPIGDLQISKSYLTIDGSTAPSPGITLTNVGRLVLEASGSVPVHDIIVNNIRAIGDGGSVEADDLWELDGSSGAPVHHVVLDHLTMIGSGDGNVDIYGDVHDITLSNSLILDSIQGQHFSEAGGLRERLTIYGNVYARLNERQPRIRYNTRQVDFVGNVIYGWGWHEGGAAGLNIDAGNGTPSANVEQNAYLYVSGLSGAPDDALKVDDMGGSWFFQNNTWPGGESQGDAAANSSRISMVHNGIDYSAPRQAADVRSAGTHFPTAAERQLLDTVNSAGQGSGGGSGGGGSGDGGSGDGGSGDGGSGDGGSGDGGSGDGGSGDGGSGDGGDDDVPPPPPPPSTGWSEQFPGVPEPWAGYDAQPFGFSEMAFKNTINAGEVVAWTATGGGANLNCNGTAENPGFLINRGRFTGTVAVTGKYCILIGGTYAGQDTALGIGGDHITVRDARIIDNDEGNGSAIYTNGSNVVIMDSVVGPDQPLTWRGEDHHCWKLAGNNIWSVRNRFEDCLGDAIQVGDQNNSPGSISKIYIIGNHAERSNQSGFWVKNATDVLIAYNTARDHNAGGDAVAASAGGQYSHSYVWFLENDFADSPIGIRIASTDGGTGRYYIGNRVQTNYTPGSDPWGVGFALQSWSDGPVYAYDNVASSAAGARAALQGCGNEISGQTVNVQFTSSCDLSAARQLYQQRFGVAAAF